MFTGNSDLLTNFFSNKSIDVTNKCKQRYDFFESRATGVLFRHRIPSFRCIPYRTVYTLHIDSLHSVKAILLRLILPSGRYQAEQHRYI